MRSVHKFLAQVAFAATGLTDLCHLRHLLRIRIYLNLCIEFVCNLREQITLFGFGLNTALVSDIIIKTKVSHETLIRNLSHTVCARDLDKRTTFTKSNIKMLG